MTQHAEKCPVCQGKTEMPASFYDDLGNDGLVECRSCKGKGYILVGYPDAQPWQPAPDWWHPQPLQPMPYRPIVWSVSTDTLPISINRSSLND